MICFEHPFPAKTNQTNYYTYTQKRNYFVSFSYNLYYVKYKNKSITQVLYSPSHTLLLFNKLLPDAFYQIVLKDNF